MTPSTAHVQINASKASELAAEARSKEVLGKKKKLQDRINEILANHQRWNKTWYGRIFRKTEDVSKLEYDLMMESWAFYPNSTLVEACDRVQVLARGATEDDTIYLTSEELKWIL